MSYLNFEHFLEESDIGYKPLENDSDEPEGKIKYYEHTYVAVSYIKSCK